MNEIKECKWLNTNYGYGYWICNGFLKPTNEEICKNCTENSYKKLVEEDKNK
jgi:hypothetical protein